MFKKETASCFVLILITLSKCVQMKGGDYTLVQEIFIQLIKHKILNL